MKSGSALILSLIFAVTLAGSALAAQQGDRVIIRGPAGSEQADVRVSQERYGPITRADTLWSIATQVRPHSSVSVQQVMSAIVQANPHAFLNNNPNAMETGFILRIPSLQEIQMINPEAARRHIELGEQLQQSSQRLQSNRNEAALTAAERNTVLNQTREEAQQALQNVRDNYAGEFAELRTQMARSIENTESVYVANEELRARIDAIADTLEDIQRNMVAESEFQAQVRALMEDQQELRLNQQAQQELAQERGLANQIMNNPLALILLAFVPALLLILIATLVLRRRDGGNSAIRPGATDTPVNPITDNAPPVGLNDSAATAEDFELDEAMAEFDDLEDDDGDDLSALEDEMLVPEQDDESIQLDDDLYDDLDELDLSEFDALDEDLMEPDNDAEPKQESASTERTEPVTEVPFEEGDQALSQDDLDMLFAGGLGQEDDKATGSGEPTAAVADVEPLAAIEKEEATEDEPSPAELFASDEDSLEDDELEESLLNDSADNGAEGESDESVFATDPKSLDEEDDFDFEKMIEDYSEDDMDMELDDDDIDSLLTKSDELFNETGILDDGPAKSAAESEPEADESDLADEDELAADTEANDLKAEDKLDFDDEEADGSPAKPDNEFLDIDDILEEAENAPEELEDSDDVESQESGRAVQEDTLAAQLDLARAYLEMEEVEEARETVIAVINQATGELLEEANELLARIDG